MTLGSRVFAYTVAALLSVATTAPAARAQASATLRPDERAYRDLETLHDAGLLDSLIVGQRPYSRTVIARAGREALHRLGASSRPDDAVLLHIADRLAALQPPVTSERPVAHAGGRAEVLYGDAESRPITDNGVGTVEADVNPLLAYRSGRSYLPGVSLVASIAPDAQWRWLSGQLEPRLFAAAAGHDADATASLELASGSLRLVGRGVALTLGREYTVWSQLQRGGLFFSENAPALDMVGLATDGAVVLPGVLRRVGPVAASLRVADLGRSDSNSHSRLVAYKLSARPVHALEVGATFMNHFGGAGARNPSALDRFVDLVPFLDLLRRHPDSLGFDSDKVLGLDANFRVPRLAGAVLFGEMAIEDFDFHRLGSVFTEDAAYTFGVRLPRLVSPEWSAQLAWSTLGIRFYEHHSVRNGLAAHRLLLGDALGRDASGLSARLRWRDGTDRSLEIDGAVEGRGNDQFFGSYVNADQTGLVFRRVAAGVVERRVRGVTTWRMSVFDERTELALSAGVERTSSVANVAGRDRVAGLGMVSITVTP